MSNKIIELIKNIAKSHGIYQFFDSNSKIIYIGKSVNLKARVSSYFNDKQKLTFAKKKMVKQISDIKTIITNNETESLILETTLIKKHQPKYNILMKDGKNHVYIKITNEIIPRIIKTRIKNGNGIYFGPYTSTNYINNILKFLKRNFSYRTCNLSFKKNKNNEIVFNKISGLKIPCIDYYIKTCTGPCLLEKENINNYLQKIEEIKLFLKGNISKTIESLKIEMQKKAELLQFEEAAKIKKTIESIKVLNINQIVREGVVGNYYVINYVNKFEKFYVGMIEIKNSKITGYYNYDIENKLNENKEEIIKKFIENKFVEEKNKNFIFLLPFKIKGEINNNIKIEIPKIGVKKELLTMCYKNIYEYAYKSHINSLSTKGFTQTTMKNLLEIFGYKQINKKIIFECNDISHITGNHTVASRSIIENGKKNPQKYKKFKIKTLENGKINDFGSLNEIINRRIKELEKFGNIPDLIVIDGGKGQLSGVQKIIKKSKFDLQIISIAKKEEEVFLPNKKESIILEKDSNELRLLQMIRDEAHRFAINFNREKRIKGMKKNILESLPSIGPKTRKKLLQKYTSIEKIKNISEEELLKIINKTQLEVLKDHGIV